MFCPKCGTEKGPFVEGFCVKCYKEDHALATLPEKMKLQRCVHCGKLYLSGKWQEESKETLSSFLLAKLKVKGLNVEAQDVHIEAETKGGLHATVQVKGRAEGQPISAEAETLLQTEKTVCPACSRITGGYYEAVLQVRFDTKEHTEQSVRETIEAFLANKEKIEPLARVVKDEKDKNGFNLRIGSKTAAKQLARHLAQQFKSKVISSHSLVGVDRDGQKRMRDTYCVRV